MPKLISSCPRNGKRAKIDLKNNSKEVLEATLSHLLRKVVTVNTGRGVSGADDLDTLLLGDSNLKFLRLDDCVTIAVSGGGADQISDVLTECSIGNFKRIVICCYGNDLTNRSLNWTTLNVRHQLRRVRALGGQRLELFLIEPLTRYIATKPNFNELISNLFERISCFSGVIKIQNRIGRDTPQDRLNGPEGAVGCQCFKEDGTHLRGPAIAAFSLLQYYVSRKDMKYETRPKVKSEIESKTN
jgi:hypothetical protein